MRCLAIFACVVSAYAADVRDVNRTVPLNGKGLLEIETHKGSIKVSVWDRQEVEIHARIAADAGTSFLSQMDRRRFDATEVRIDASSDAVRVQTYYPEFSGCCSFDSGNNPEVRYTIHMPKTARLKIKDHRSDTEVLGLLGALDLNTYRGTARVSGLGGALHLETYRGDAKVEFSAFTGDSSVKTYRGNVEVSMPKSSRFDLRTNSGRRGSIYTDFPVMTRAMARTGEHNHAPVNGGGPSFRIEAERGEVELHAR
jgi:hypothetical protein